MVTRIRCDFITIPHNSNLVGGGKVFPPMLLDPYNVAKIGSCRV